MPDEEKKETTETPAATPVSEPEVKLTAQEAAAVDKATEEAAKPTQEAAIPEEVKGEAEVVKMLHRDLKTGMWVRVHENIKDVNAKGEERQRVQIFEGLVIGVRGAGISRTILVRKNAGGWMVEKIYPLSSPNIVKVEVVKAFRARRARLTYLRGRFRRKLVEIKPEKIK